MKQGIARFFGLWLCTLATGCAFSGRYHVSQDDGAILMPHTARTGDQVVIFVRDVFRYPDRACQGLSRSGGGLDVAGVQLWTGGQFHRALRVRGATSTFAHSDQIQQAVESWWGGLTAVPDCLADGAKGSIIRSLIGQRPMASDAAIEQWYGPGTGINPPRVLLLRAGMRVCAHEATSSTNQVEYRLGAVDCARVIDTVDGPLFDPVVARFQDALSSPPNIGLPSAWTEVRQPFKRKDGSRPAYLLVYSKQMPTAPSGTALSPDSVNYLIAVDLAKDDAGEPAINIVRRLSRSSNFYKLCSFTAFIACIKLGERTTFIADFPISLNGRTIDMPVGTTVQSLLPLAAPDLISFDLLAPSDDGGKTDPAVEARLNRSLAKARMTRWFDGRRVSVELNGAAALTLPLQPGDEIRW